MKPEEIVQGSAIWLAWRSKRIGASESAAILGISPWSTRYQLWCLKTDQPLPNGKSANNFSTNRAMDIGNRFEGAIRAHLELLTGLDFPAKIVVHPDHPFIVASLDGMDDETGILAEFKAPGKDVFNAAKLGVLSEEDDELIKARGWKIREHCVGVGICPPKYYVQCQQQLMCSGGKKVLFFCGQVTGRGNDLDVTDTALVEVLPDLEFQKMLLFEILSFWDFVAKRHAPPLTDKDVLYPDDQSTVFLFERLLKCKQEFDEAKKSRECLEAKEHAFEEVKREAIDHVETELKHPKVCCLGVRMIKNKKGSWSVSIA